MTYQIHEREVVGSIVFSFPQNFGFVGEWVSNGGEAAFEELGEAFVFRLLGIGFEEIEGEDGILDDDFGDWHKYNKKY